MELYDEDKRRKENKMNSKLNKIIVASIILVIIIIIGLIVAIYYLMNNPNKLTVKLNGVENVELETMLKVDYNINGSINVDAPIKEFAKIVKYQGFNGEYQSSSQDTDKCYVTNNEEVTTFYLDSSVINKKDLTVSDSEYESYEIEKQVYEKDGVLYANEKGLEKGFNLYMSYDSKKKILNINTLDTEVANAKFRAINTFGLQGIDEETFSNKKAILDRMIVVVSGDEKYGVIDYSTGSSILEIKYDSIKYIPAKSEFIVKMNNKVGITKSNGQEKIKAIYDNLILIDKEKEWYIAQQNRLYGVIDAQGNTIIYPEYNQIGIDATKFEQNGVKSGYILLDRLIPVKQGNKWAFFDINTKAIITEFQYDSIGSITVNKSATTYNLLVIPEVQAIVVKKEDGYNFITLTGEEIFKDIQFPDAFIRISSGKPSYYMVWDEKEYNIVEMINKLNA